MQPRLPPALHAPRDPALQLPVKLGTRSQARTKRESFPEQSVCTSPQREPAPVASGDPVRETFAFSTQDGQCCQPGTQNFAALEGGTPKTGTVCSKDKKTAQKYCNCAFPGQPAHGAKLILLEILPAQLLHKPTLRSKSPLFSACFTELEDKTSINRLTGNIRGFDITTPCGVF